MKNMKKLVVASSNKGKISEISEILKDLYEVIPMEEIGFKDEIEETGSTFEENSYIKAKAVYDFCHLASLADDSGLMVECLNGAPGVYSARYAGEQHSTPDNNALLLKNLKDEKNRRAKFVSVVTLIKEDGTIITARGETSGKILTKCVGKNGFGYDPLFLSDDLGKSFGEATQEEKDRVSHRARALEELAKKLR